MFGVSVGIMDGAGGAAGGSFEPIQTYTATGVESNITFSGIVGTYKHLQLRTMVKDAYVLGSATSTLCSVQLNATGGTSYADHFLKGDGSSATAGGTASTAAIATIFSSTYGPTTNTFAVSIIDFIDYASTTKNKTVRGITGANFNTTGTDFQVVLGSGLFMSTSAITSIKLLPAIAAFGAGSVFSLYGIKG